MAVENALHPDCADHEPPTDKARLIRNIILGCEFVMSHITHFYTLAALSYVQGPPIAPWTPWFDNSYYIGDIAGLDLLLNPGGTTPVPRAAKLNLGQTYTGIDGIWDNVVLDYVVALKYRREAAHLSAILGGRTPQIQNGCIVGGATHEPSAEDLDLVSDTMTGIAGFIEDHQIPLTHIVSYLYGDHGGSTSGDSRRVYDNDGTDPDTGYGSGSGSADCSGARRVLAWGVFDEDTAGGDDPDRLLKRGCYEWNGSAMEEVAPPTGMWDLLTEEIENSRYDDDADKAAHPLHPSEGYTKPNATNDYSWAKSPRMDGKACQVGPLARMAVLGARDGDGSTEYFSYRIGSTKPHHLLDHPYISPILSANLGTVTGAFGGRAIDDGFLCGFSTMDRHRARAYEALKIANAVTGWCGDYATAVGDAYAIWSAPSSTDGTVATGYGAHEAPRGALAHFVEVTNGKISNYQAIVPTTWNVNPLANGYHGPIESAIIGIDVSGVQSAGPSGDQTVAVEALRVVQGFDPCIACTVH